MTHPEERAKILSKALDRVEAGYYAPDINGKH